MKTISYTGVASLAVSLSLWSAAPLAQEQNPTFVPVEIYTCNFNKGKDSKDLQRVIDKWNKWSDENDNTPYTAWLMTPFIHGASIKFDVGWMGAWPDGKAMGASLAKWLEDGGSLQGEFDKVIDCDAHSTSASMMIRAPGSEWPGSTGMATFTDCTIAEGKTAQDAMAVHQAWAKHLDETKSKAGMWAFWPGFGADNRDDDGEQTYDYKVVGSHPDMTSVGADWESYTNGGGWRTAQGLTDGVVDCDSARVYHTRMIRNGNFDPR